MKILKRQQGGLQYIHVPTIYGDNNAQATQASEKKSDGTASDTVKELYSAIRQEGLPVDVSMFLYKAQEILSEPDYGLGSSDNTFTKIMQLHDLANRVKWNKNEMDRAQKNIDESGTGDDYAIASDGKFYVMDTNRKITTMSYDDIKENSDKYMMLTNSQLLQERANTFGNNMETRMINDVANYIGMNEVMDDIRGVVKEFGNNELKGYLAKAPGKVIKGFEHLYELMNDGPEGLYEFQAKDSVAKSNILAAASYIINNLNRNAQKTLKANADLNGIDVSKMVLSAIIDHTDSSYEVEKVDDNTGSKSSGSGGSGSGKDIPYIVSAAMGKGSDYKPVVIGGSTDKGGIKAWAQPYAWLTEDGKQISTTNFEALLQQSEIGKMIDKGSISMGGSLLDPGQIGLIMWDGTSFANRIELPIDIKAKAQGDIKPDLNAYAKYEKFIKWCDEHPGTSIIQQKEQAREMGLDIYFDEKSKQWKFNPNASSLFFVSNGYVNDRAISINENSKWVEHVPNDMGRNIIDQYLNAVNYGTTSPNKNSKPIRNVEIGTPAWDFDLFGDGHRLFYKVPIFMPVKSEIMAFSISEFERTPESGLYNITQKEMLRREANNTRTNF